MAGPETIEDVADTLARLARGAGADEALAHAATSEALEASVRLGAVEDVERSESRSAHLRVFVGAKAATVTTQDWSRAALQDLAEKAVAIARAGAEDPYAGPPPEDRLIGTVPDLALLDEADPDVEALIERAREAEDEARAGAEIVNSNGAGASRRRARKAVANGRGFTASLIGGSHGLGVSVLGERDGKREIGGEGRGARRLADLPEPAAIGALAARRARDRLGAKRAKSAQVPVAFDRLVAPSVIRALAGALSGPAAARGVSWLLGKPGTKIAPEGITLRDDPLIPAGLGSRPFDGEGVACAARDLIADGVLGGWLHDAASARQMGEAVTGHATAGGGVATSNLDLLPGALTRDELFAEIGDGLLVEGMFGLNVNPNTGAFSVGVYGRWIEGGVPAWPVSEATVAGEMLPALATLQAADDFERRDATNAPTIRLDTLTVAGE